MTSDTRVSEATLTDLVARIFAAAGNARDHARMIARQLVGANLAGHDSHGVIRVPHYLQWQRDGIVVANRTGRVVTDHGALAVIDGEFGYGQVVGELAVAEGIRRVAQCGVALIALRHAGHLGRIGAWAEQAAERRLVSLHFVNSPGKGGIQVAPFGGRERRLAPNPLAIGIPRKDAPPLVLDITTSVVPEGKVRVALNRGVELPPGAAIDAAGKPTRDPAAYYGPPAGALLAMGGHKGSGLCLMIDLLAGALTGGGASDPRVSGRGNNMLSIYIDPEHLSGRAALDDAAADLAAWVSSATPIAPDGEVLAPGDMEMRCRRDRSAHGIPLDATTWGQICQAAEALGVVSPAPVGQ
jgi:hydroxycarboxylate dehydrogenase B